MDKKSILGRAIKYFDYLDSERFGKIIALEPSSIDDLMYVYIQDEDPEYNIHTDAVNGVYINYADIRLSSQVYFDD